MYSLMRKVLFQFSPETSHELALEWLGAAHRLGLLSLVYDRPVKPVRVMGLHFPNPVGLAAGLDKNGDYYHALGALGFGFVEIGTVTPVAQPGNPQPRLFRLPECHAIINRMGFNNLGVEHLVDRVRRKAFPGVLGINIGKNKHTPDERALDDYRLCMRAVFPYADYVTINISSPNTPGLRNLQFGAPLEALLAGVRDTREQLADQHGRRVPIALKIAPDMDEDEVRQVADALVKHEMSAVIATNTTISREEVATHPLAGETGGLSGAPVKSRADRVIRILCGHLKGELPIIGVGGILSGRDVKDKIDAGADLVQIYSGFIYRGPKLIKEAVEAFG